MKSQAPSVRKLSRNVGGVVTEDSEDDGNHLAANMADGGHVIFTFGAFAFVKGMNGRVFEGSDG